MQSETRHTPEKTTIRHLDWLGVGVAADSKLENRGSDLKLDRALA